MIEAVGFEYWATYFQTIERVLAPGGKVAIQAITIAHDRLHGHPHQLHLGAQVHLPGRRHSVRARHRGHHREADRTARPRTPRHGGALRADPAALGGALHGPRRRGRRRWASTRSSSACGCSTSATPGPASRPATSTCSRSCSTAALNRRTSTAVQITAAHGTRAVSRFRSSAPASGATDDRSSAVPLVRRHQPKHRAVHRTYSRAHRRGGAPVRLIAWDGSEAGPAGAPGGAAEQRRTPSGASSGRRVSWAPPRRTSPESSTSTATSERRTQAPVEGGPANAASPVSVAPTPALPGRRRAGLPRRPGGSARAPPASGAARPGSRASCTACSGTGRPSATTTTSATTSTQLILDRHMAYSSGYWTLAMIPTTTLEDAQRDKLDLVCRKIGLTRARACGSWTSAAGGVR